MSLKDGALSLAPEDSPVDEVLTPKGLFAAPAEDGRVAIHPTDVAVPATFADPEEFHTRLFDILFAIMVLVAVAPVLVLVIVALQAASPGPIFFVQQRVGRDGTLFPCFKLRTMVPDAAERLEKLLSESAEARAEWHADHKLRNDPRITSLGRFARAFSLDELPQLANILLGHMSVVGPRPIVEAEIWRYGSAFADYCSVRPGLTGLWQVSGRNDTSYEERVRLDSEYARDRNLVLNLKIITRTFSVVLGRRGAY